MSKYLLVDIGAGTMDILYYDTSSKRHYKAVVPSPVHHTAKMIAMSAGNLLITGLEMGGGPVTDVLRERARTHEVIMSESAAATLSHDLQRVATWGIRVVGDKEAAELKTNSGYSHFLLADLDLPRLKNIFSGFGIPFSFDLIGICAQDHGVPPPGISHLDYRHGIFAELLDKDPYPHTLLYEQNQIPKNMNRLRSLAESARETMADEIYVMDSGMAAILGASLDNTAENKDKIMVLDVATSHTLCALLERGQLAGFFEYHTRDITLERLEILMQDQANGKLHHRQILSEGGHGAYTRKSFGFEALEAIIVTGPKRAILKNTKLPITYGAPMGDNMMTGTAGLLEAIRRRKGLPPIDQ
jgi:uncharacterized protein (DUF1786 family)